MASEPLAPRIATVRDGSAGCRPARAGMVRLPWGAAR